MSARCVFVYFHLHMTLLCLCLYFIETQYRARIGCDRDTAAHGLKDKFFLFMALIRMITASTNSCLYSMAEERIAEPYICCNSFKIHASRARNHYYHISSHRRAHVLCAPPHARYVFPAVSPTVAESSWSWGNVPFRSPRCVCVSRARTTKKYMAFSQTEIW